MFKKKTDPALGATIQFFIEKIATLQVEVAVLRQDVKWLQGRSLEDDEHGK